MCAPAHDGTVRFPYFSPPPQVEQTVEASHHIKSSEEVRAAMEELQERNKALEEETVTQKHLLHLEKIKAEREYEEIKEEKTRLMSDLEQEKNKLLADIQQLNKNKVRHWCLLGTIAVVMCLQLHNSGHFSGS